MARSNKREQIMRVAEKLFTSKRLHEITLDDIVREACVGKGTVYTYFKDKDDLFFQVATGGFEELCELLVRRVAEDAPFRQQLLQACTAITTFFRGRRQLFRMIQTEDARMSLCHGHLQARWAEKRRQLVQSLGKILRKGQSDGLVRHDMPDETLASFLLGLLRSRARMLHDGGINVTDELVVDLFMGGAETTNAGVPQPAGGGSTCSEE